MNDEFLIEKFLTDERDFERAIRRKISLEIALTE